MYAPKSRTAATGEQPADILLEPIELDRIDLSVRTANCLKNACVSTVGELSSLTAADILGWQNAGKKTLSELRDCLGRLGLKLRGDSRPAGSPDPALLTELSLPPEIASESLLDGFSIDLDKADPNLQRMLVSKLTEFSLSTRAQNVLAQGKVTYLGELVQLSSWQLRSISGSGKRTVDELASFCADHGLSLGTPILNWSKDRAAQLRASLARSIEIGAVERSMALLARIAPEPISLEDELRRIVLALETGRNVTLLVKLWGWDGDEPRTLESVGSELGLTRERVRQIEARALRNLKRYRFELPILRSAVVELERIAPMKDEEAAQAIRAAGLTRNPFSPWSLKKATKIFRMRWQLSRLQLKGGGAFLVKQSQVEQLQRLLPVLRQKTSELGCTSVMALLADLGLDETESSTAIAILDFSGRVEWLDEAKTWLFDREAARNRLYNICAKVLSVCPQIRTSELRRAVSRSRRLAMAPSQRVLAKFISLQCLGRVDNDVVIGDANLHAMPAADSVEGKMIAVLDQFGPVMDGEEFAEHCVAAGVNGTSFYVYRMMSPLITSLGNGVYSKVGADVAPGIVEDIVARRRKVTRVSDHGWTEAGRLWFGLELSMQMIVAGGIRMIGFVSDLVQGEWNVLLPDDTRYGTVQCKEIFIWSFRKAFNALGAEPGDLAAFEFELKSRNVVVRVGGPGLFDRVQEGMENEESTEGEEL